MPGLEQYEPGLTDRAVFVGQTGSGKTTLARELLKRRQQHSRILIFDWKGTFKPLPGFKRYTRLKKLVEENRPHVIYAPHYDEMSEPDFIDAFFRFAFERQRRDYLNRRRFNTLVYVDEVYAVTLEGKFFARFYSASMTRGREFGVAVWSATQLPVSVPSRILSESEHYYVFFLKNPDHRDKVESMTGVDADAIFQLPKRFFYYADAEGNVSPRRTLKFKRRSKS